MHGDLYSADMLFSGAFLELWASGCLQWLPGCWCCETTPVAKLQVCMVAGSLGVGFRGGDGPEDITTLAILG